MESPSVTTDVSLPAPPFAARPTPEGVEAFLGAGGVAGLFFTASWCAAGVLLERQFDDIASDAKVPLVVVDCEAFPHLADRFQIRSLPTFVLMRGEREEGRLLGAFSGDQVRSLLDRPALNRAAVKGTVRSAVRAANSNAASDAPASPPAPSGGQS